MSYVLNSAAEFRVDAAGTRKPGFWHRLYAAMLESRRRSAIREMRARAAMVHEAETVLGGFPQTTLNTDVALPFNR